jgi:hypothetical protein
MRRAMLALTVVAAMTIGARVQGEDAAPTSTTAPPANPPPAQTTVVEGTPPAIEGRWLLLASLGVAQGAKRIVPSAFDITQKDGKLDIRERHVILPPAQNEALSRGNDELGGVWAPSPDDLAAIAAAWNTMQVEDRGIKDMTHQVTARDAFDDVLKEDALTKDALWVLRQAYVFLSGGNRPVSQGNLIAPTKLEGGVYSGNYLALAVAAAPFPIPIKFDGTFRLIPIGVAAPSWWTRLGDFFAGCNRR